MIKRECERWEDIPGFPNYEIGDDREIRNKRTGRILKQCDNNSGYPTVNLYNDGKRTTKGVHRIVAESFVDGYEDGLEVNHKDGNKHNNHRDNLEWGSRGYNESHAYKHGLKYGPKHQPVRVIETGEVFGSIKECARAIGGDERHITKCLRGMQNTHLGLTYEYADKYSINMLPCDYSRSYACAKRVPYRRAVRIIETGEVFPSIGECARSINGDSASIVGCLSGRHHTHRGYHYEYVE